MRLRILTLLFAAPLLATVAGLPALPQNGKPTIYGEIPLPEVSGATFISDDCLLLAADDPGKVNGKETQLVRVRNARALLQGKNVAEAALEPLEDELAKFSVASDSFNDLEDIAWDGKNTTALFVASSSRNKKGHGIEKKPTRFRVLRARFDPKTSAVVDAGLSDALPAAIGKSYPFLTDALGRTPAQCGFNIEGAAWVPAGNGMAEDLLLLGLRSPTRTSSASRPKEHKGQEDALVLPLTHPSALWQPAPSFSLAPEFSLDLNGRGIRGMAYDPTRHKCWVLAGMSPDPNLEAQSPWALYLWDPAQPNMPGVEVLGHPRADARDVQLSTPEAVCTVTIGNQPYLLLVEDGERASRYALLPAP